MLTTHTHCRIHGKELSLSFTGAPFCRDCRRECHLEIAALVKDGAAQAALVHQQLLAVAEERAKR